jgi:hypothetical protein
LYRYYFYRHQHQDALAIADQVLDIVARRLDFALDWRRVTIDDVKTVAGHSTEWVRFYLLALKGAGYLSLRLDDLDGGLKRLNKVAELDPKDRIGAAALSAVAVKAMLDAEKT